MVLSETLTLEETIRDRVQTWTSRRVRGLVVALRGKMIVLTGKTSSFHIKQLAQRGAQEVAPHTPITNEIAVDSRR